jgi:predicted kinase
MELHGSKNYEEAWKKVNQKRVNKILNERILEANQVKEDVILDMTHMTSKRRRIHCGHFSKDYYKMGVIFPILSDEEYIKRNSIRQKEENKNIGMGVIRNMISQYQTIKSEEGFDEIITLK